MHPEPSPTQHPLWSAFLRLDKQRHCGVPDMTDSGDRKSWEIFQQGYMLGATELAAKQTHIETLCSGIATCLAYPRGSEAQVRCLEELAQDAAHIAKNLQTSTVSSPQLNRCPCSFPHLPQVS